MIIMRKAAMPIPYIITLIIGVLVVAVLAYWFISSGGKASGIGKEAECTARKGEFCATQSESNWGKLLNVCGDKKFKQILDDPATTTKNEADNQCYSFCKALIPTWSPLSTNSHPECKKP